MKDALKPTMETEKFRKELSTIGWGVNNPRISQELTNVQKPRIPKPTVRYLDSVKSSNFINFLHTKKNEINHEKQDYWHPRMFYLTGNKPMI